jgi:predicted MPP superfamily phosphohydrolase
LHVIHGHRGSPVEVPDYLRTLTISNPDSYAFHFPPTKTTLRIYSQPDRFGTLWFDEVFDVLDEDGVTAVCATLEELAAERCVVVITHNPVVIEQLPNAAHLRMERGVARWITEPRGAGIEGV